MGAKAPQPPALGEAWGAPPLASYIRRGWGGLRQPLVLLPKPPPPSLPWPPCATSPPGGLPHSTSPWRHPSRRAAAISSTKAAAPSLVVGLLHHLLSLSSCLAWRSHARGDLHHQRHHNRRGAEIHLAISTLLVGSRRRRSTSSCTCGYRRGAARAVLHRIGSRRG